MSFEDVKCWQEAKRFAGCVVAFKADLFQYKPTKGLFDGIKYALIACDSSICNLCEKEGYKIDFFCNKNDKDEKLSIVLCDEKFKRLDHAFFKARLLTLEEVKRILNLINNQEYIFGDLSLELMKSKVLQTCNLLPDEKRKYIRKYLYNKLPSVGLILLATEDPGSLFIKLPKEIYHRIIRFLLYAEAEDARNDLLFLEL